MCRQRFILAQFATRRNDRSDKRKPEERVPKATDGHSDVIQHEGERIVYPACHVLGEDNTVNLTCVREKK